MVVVQVATARGARGSGALGLGPQAFQPFRFAHYVDHLAVNQAGATTAPTVHGAVAGVQNVECLIGADGRGSQSLISARHCVAERPARVEETCAESLHGAVVSMFPAPGSRAHGCETEKNPPVARRHRRHRSRPLARCQDWRIAC